MSTDTEELFEIIESEDRASRNGAAALAKLEQVADNGDLDVAEGIAEVFAFSERYRDPEKAYFWYHVAHGARGYAARFENVHDTVEQYCGPVGDFRNEAQVQELVGELGEFRVRQIDARASAWLAKHRGG